jgi:hypothetical protein
MGMAFPVPAPVDPPGPTMDGTGAARRLSEVVFREEDVLP